MSPLVRILLGSKTDLPHGEKVQDFLKMFNVPFDFYVSSAHRKPNQTSELAKNAKNEGIKVIIALAGMAAHLPGVIASHTTLPVIGVPLTGPNLSGEDALYSVVQMPTGVPVATVAIDGAKNAALLAVQILSLTDENIAKSFEEYKKSLAK